MSTHVHFRGAAPQQINKGGVERHDGIPQMDTVLLMLFLPTKPANQESGNYLSL